MRLIFAGTPEFAARALDALVLAGHEIALVFTQPDRPAGRGLHLKPSAVKKFAAERGLPLAQPAALQSPEIAAVVSALAADAMIVAAYGLIIPADLLQLPRLGGINIHASLLPRWRGAAPVQRAILAGDSTSGISIMQMDAGLDSGPILSRHEIAIAGNDSAASLTEKLAALGARAIVEALAALEAGQLAALPQDGGIATYAHKITKEEARLDWTLDAAVVERAVRAYNPFPGAGSLLNGHALKIWQACAVDGDDVPGTVIGINRQGITIACGRGAILVSELQLAGAKRAAPAAFLAGSQFALGMTLGR